MCDGRREDCENPSSTFPLPLLCFRLKAGLLSGLRVSSELFITAKNCQEHSTRRKPSSRNRVAQAAGASPRTAGRIRRLPWLALPENICKASLLSVKTVGKALFVPKEFVPARPEVDALRFKLKSGAGRVGCAYTAGAVRLAPRAAEGLHRLRCFLTFSVCFV